MTPDPTGRSGTVSRPTQWPPPSKPVSHGRTAAIVIVWLVASTLSAVGLLALQPLAGIDMGLLSLVMFSPAIGAAVCWAIFRGDTFQSGTRAGTSAFTTSLALSLLATVLYFTAISIARGSPPDVPSEVAGAPVLVMIALQTLGALGEEIGYRGLLFDSMRRWFRRPLAAVVVGVLFGFWHIQNYGLPLPQFVAFVAACVALTITMAYVMTGRFWQRMASCTIIHLGANLAFTFVGTDTVAMTTYSAAVIIAAIVVVPLAILSERRSAKAVRSS